ncbi:hypothetical protein ACP70R_010346 [Stipagrostis hirtigluma subsp. patula]
MSSRAHRPEKFYKKALFITNPSCALLLPLSFAMANNLTSAVANHGHCLSETSSRCVTGSVTAAHNFEVTNFSLLDGIGIGKYVSSSTFTVGARDWNIRLYPDGWEEEDKAAYVSVSLTFLRGAVGVRAKFSVGVSQGWQKCMEKSKLQPLLRFNNDCFTIRFVLTVIKESHAEEVVKTIEIPQSNMHQHFEHLLKNGKGADVTFSVDGQLFDAHRCVLAARSPVFEAELFGPMKKKPRQHIKIEDVEPAIFEALLHFIYTDSLSDNCNADENVAMQHLLVAADRYGLDRLRLMCEAKLYRGIDVHTVATTLTLAEQHHCLQLKETCLRFMASQDVLAAVMDTDGFKHLLTSSPLITKEISNKVAAIKRQ